MQLLPRARGENVETDWEEGSYRLKLRPWKRGAAGSRLVSLLLEGKTHGTRTHTSEVGF